jgi:hypothetical protein
MPRIIGRKYGPNLQYGEQTELIPELEGTFGLSTFPDLTFRVHPQCDGLICRDNEVVVQSKNGPPERPWLDFIREDQHKVFLYVSWHKPA